MGAARPEAMSGRLPVQPGAGATGATESLFAAVQAFFRPHLQPSFRLCLGLSGGIDSMVLLHLLHRLREVAEFELSAVHVHHGLSPNAGHWADFCAEQCVRLAVPLAIVRVQVDRASGQGIEAAARAARYAVFAAQDCDAVVLAQHRDDQAETLLLQLLRGAGLKGLACMPAERQVPSGSLRLLRPLLGHGRDELQAYAAAMSLSFVEDESNTVSDFSRNYLRLEVLPLLERRFPAYRRTLGRAAQHFADAAGLLDELAGEDLARLTSGPDLNVPALASLSRPRARNLLRYYLSSRGLSSPSAAWLEEALEQLLGARADACVRVGQGGWSLMRHRQRIALLELTAVRPVDVAWVWQGEALLDLGAWGQLAFTPGMGEGLSREKLARASVRAGLRRGGERFQEAGRPRRALKKLLQERAIPPWERQGMPLLYCGDAVAWVAGMGPDADFQAGPGEPSWLIEWRRSRD